MCDLIPVLYHSACERIVSKLAPCCAEAIANFDASLVNVSEANLARKQELIVSGIETGDVMLVLVVVDSFLLDDPILQLTLLKLMIQEQQGKVRVCWIAAEHARQLASMDRATRDMTRPDLSKCKRLEDIEPLTEYYLEETNTIGRQVSGAASEFKAVVETLLIPRRRTAY